MTGMVVEGHLRIGGLCFGYGGLDMAVQAVIPDAELAWYAEFDKGASKIGAHRFPGVPNHGDMTRIDWAAVEPIDIITGGTPCQDLSHAGKRKGMTEGTRSNLWVAMREAIAQLKPRLVVWENVGGAASAEADSDVEPCPGCVGDGPGVHLRALGRVVGDLSSLGYVGSVRALRASDVGAPHGRLRYFLAAEPADQRHEWTGASRGRWAGPTHGRLLPTPRATRGGSNTETVGLLPTPRATDGTKGGPNQRGSSGDLMLPSAVHLLPTPTAKDAAASGGSTSSDVTLTDATVRTQMGTVPNGRLLQTPSVADALGGHLTRSGVRGDEQLLPGQAKEMHGQQWGIYADAIARWESLTRPAPAPTQISKKGTPQLAPAFSEWMMGLPAGWVTDVPDITRNEALKALGNGVVPQQAEAALRHMLDTQAVAA